MKRICAWCKTVLAEAEEFAADGDITHGICSVCVVQLTGDLRRSAQQILDLLNEPVFIVDGDGAVTGCNQAAQKMLSKSADEITNRFGGEVFECEYSTLPGGCGKTVHCGTCAIRNTVMDTLKSGNNYSKVPAYQSIRRDNCLELMRFWISTERVENRILLRIDEAKALP